MPTATTIKRIDITRPLTPLEAGRVKTVLEQKQVRVKLRWLTGFSPREIAANPIVNIPADEIARAAGREPEPMPT